MSTLHLKSPSVTVASLVSTERGVTRLWALLATWQRRARERAELARLTPERLHDIGLSAEQIAEEASKPFWRA